MVITDDSSALLFAAQVRMPRHLWPCECHRHSTLPPIELRTGLLNDCAAVGQGHRARLGRLSARSRSPGGYTLPTPRLGHWPSPLHGWANAPRALGHAPTPARHALESAGVHVPDIAADMPGARVLVTDSSTRSRWLSRSRIERARAIGVARCASSSRRMPRMCRKIWQIHQCRARDITCTATCNGEMCQEHRQEATMKALGS